MMGIQILIIKLMHNYKISMKEIIIFVKINNNIKFMWLILITKKIKKSNSKRIILMMIIIKIILIIR